MRRQVEILAPAGSYESMTAAIAAGADAVYIGGNRFGARAYADNLDQDQMEEAIDYAHLHGCHLYMTVNTLVKEGELEDLYAYLKPYYNRGLDAVIVQDFGVFAYIRKHFPDLAIHASTQMTIMGAYGAKVLKELGAARIVTARELSLEEIRTIRDKVDVEIESFVHGALCYCYSGQCLFSSLAGGRSGNRGRCAQPCRLPYDVKRDGQALNKKNENYVLSLKDLCTLDMIPDMIEAGVFSMKIEGRMKSPRYTAGVVRIYRKYVDLYLEKGRKVYRVDEGDRQMLLQLFDRGGFTEGYFRQHNGADMAALKEKPAFRQGNQELFQYLDENYVRKTLQEAVSGTVRMREGQPVRMELQCKDTAVLVEGDVVQTALNQPITAEKLKKQMRKTGNTPFVFEKLDVTVEGAGFLPVQALNELRRQGLKKLQEEILKPYRRAAGSEEMGCYRTASEMGTVPPPVPEMGAMQPPVPERKAEPPSAQVSVLELHVLLERPDCLDGVLQNPDVSEVMVESDGFMPESWQDTVRACHQSNTRCVLALPPVFRTGAVRFFDQNLKYLADSGFDGLLLRSMEEVEYLREKKIEIPWLADHGLYTFNHLAVSMMKQQGAKRITLPLELNNRELMEKGCHGAELVAYGFLPMMISAQCIRKTVTGCSKKPDILVLKDRMGKEFRVRSHCVFCYNTIYNTSPLSLLLEERLIGRLAPGSIRLQFTMETPKETEEITKAFAASFLHIIGNSSYDTKNAPRGSHCGGRESCRQSDPPQAENLASEILSCGESVVSPIKEYTRGHFKRGVE